MPKAPDFVHPAEVDYLGPQPTFEGACFVAFVDNASIKYNRSGQLAFTLVVQREHLNDQVRSVCLLAGNPIPLAVQMEVWEPYVREVAEAEEKLREFRAIYDPEEPSSGDVGQEARGTTPESAGI
jgi:hypothetical protein